MHTFSDTDFVGCRRTRRSTSSGCALLNGHLVKHWSSTQKTIALSIGEAELAGVAKASGEGLGLQSLCRDLGMEVKEEVHADSSDRATKASISHTAVGARTPEDGGLCAEQNVGY